MPSSTSSSDRIPAAAPPSSGAYSIYWIWSVRTLASLALFCIAIEGLTRLGFSHISRIEARISHDRRATVRIRKSDKPAVLFVGNSLLLEGLDEARLRDSLAREAQPVRFPIEQTEYLDWYYGLRRLFADGSQPDFVILCMGVAHLISPQIRGDYSAYYLFRAGDIPQIGREVHYDLTKTSSLLLSRFSLFYAGRSALRNFVLTRSDPAYAEVMRNIGVEPSHRLADEEIERIAEIRLAALRQLCSSHGARFAFLLAPGFGAGESAVVNAGKRSGTDVMVPIHLNEFDRDKFRDGFHLNHAGAEIFTGKVSELIQNRLVNRHESRAVRPVPAPAWGSANQLSRHPRLLARTRPLLRGY